MISSSPPAVQPSLTDVLPPPDQPPVVGQTEDTHSPIIIGAVVGLALLVAASIAIITTAAVCSIKRPCVRSMAEGTYNCCIHSGAERLA